MAVSEIDVFSPDLRPLRELANELPGRPCAQTLWRWHARGQRGVHLQVVHVNGKPYSTRNAVNHFFSAANAARRHGARN